jgi:hypothetical protein
MHGALALDISQLYCHDGRSDQLSATLSYEPHYDVSTRWSFVDVRLCELPTAATIAERVT